MKKLLFLFCMVAVSNQEVDLNQYVRSFNPKQKIEKLPMKKIPSFDFLGGIKGTKKL